MGGKGSKANIEPSKEKVIGAAGEEMHTYNDGAFKRVREAAGVADDFLMDGFDFRLKTDGGKMKEGGGKGGNLMGFTDNMMFIVKELNDTDHNTLLLYVSEYANHMTHQMVRSSARSWRTSGTPEQIELHGDEQRYSDPRECRDNDNGKVGHEGGISLHHGVGK